MKRTDWVGLSFYIVLLFALEMVARNHRPVWWGAWVAIGWAVTLTVIIIGRLYAKAEGE